MNQVEATIRRLGKSPPPRDRSSKSWTITITSGSRLGQRLTLQDLVSEAKRDGVPTSIQGLLDSADPVLGGSLSIALDAFGVKVKVGDAGYERELSAPCRFAPVESELAGDVLYFRRQACACSTSPTDLELSSRYFRSYLLASVTLVESFLNRYMLKAQHIAQIHGVDYWKLRNIEEKLEHWVRLVAGVEPSTIKQSKSWGQFCHLRQERNKLVHAADPYLGHSTSEMARTLNYCREGVGELLLSLRRAANQNTLGFIERIRLAPIVSPSRRR